MFLVFERLTSRITSFFRFNRIVPQQPAAQAQAQPAPANQNVQAGPNQADQGPQNPAPEQVNPVPNLENIDANQNIQNQPVQEPVVAN